MNWYDLVPHMYILSTVQFTPGHNLSSSYTMSQTLQTSADTANLHHSVRGQNLQYSAIQGFFFYHETQHTKNTFETFTYT